MVKLNELIITKQYIIQSYEILYINLKLNESSTIYIMIFYNDNQIVERSFMLIGQDYTDWTTDDYLYSYVNTHIEKIFNN